MPQDLQFELDDLACIMVKSHTDIPMIKKALGKEPPPDKLLITDSYQQFEKFWPTHL